MSSSSKANAVLLRLRKLHQQRIELDESYQNVSSSSSQREPISRIKKSASNGKNLQPQIPVTTRQDDLLRNSKKAQKDIYDSDLNSYEPKVETKQKASVQKRKTTVNNEISNQPTQKPPFSNSKRNLISTIEDSSKQTNQRPPFSNIKKNKFSNNDETSKQPVQRPPFSAGKKNYSSVTNETNSASKQKQKLTNKIVKSSNSGINNKKNDQLKKQDQIIHKQSLSKKTDQAFKNDILASNINKSYAPRKKALNEESDINSKKLQTDVIKATKGVERNPKSTRFSNLRSNVNDTPDNDIPSYDFRSRQTELVQNINNIRNSAVDEYYKKVPRAQTIAKTKEESQDISDELIKQAAAFLRNRKKNQASSNSSLLQKTTSPVKKDPVSRIQQEDQPFSWGNALKSISSEENLTSDSSNQNKTKKSTSIKKIIKDRQNKNNLVGKIYKGEYDESDELNLFFTPEKELPSSKRNGTKSNVYSNFNLRNNLLDESDSASIGNGHSINIKNDMFLSTESDTEIVPDSLHQQTNDFKQKGQIADMMRQKLVKVLNSDSIELSSSSDIGRPEVNKSITISKNDANNIYSNLVDSDASEDLLSDNLQQPLQQFSIIKNPNSKLSSIENYNNVNSNKLSRFAQKNIQNSNQNIFSSEADDYLSSDSKNEEIFSITDNFIDNSNIIKSRTTKFDRKPNQGKLTAEQIKKNLLDSSTDNSSTKSAEIDEFPDLIISNVSTKKAIKQYNVIKNNVLNEIQSSESSSPEFLNLASKKTLNIDNKEEDEPSQSNMLNRFGNSKLSSIVFSDSESNESRKYEKESDDVNVDDEDDDEIPAVKQPPQPEPQMTRVSQNAKVSNVANIKDSDGELSALNKDSQPKSQYSNINDENENVKMAIKSSNKKLPIQQKIPDIIEKEEEDLDDGIPVMKQPPQPEPPITEMNKKVATKKAYMLLNDSNIEDDDDEIPVAKKPPQPEPQIASVTITKKKAKALSNKNQSAQQKDSDIDDEEEDTQGSDIPLPQVDIFNNKMDSNEKSKKLGMSKLDNSNSVIDSDSDNESNIKNNSKGEKSKSSPLHLSPPIGITYFSRVDENDKFKPLSFDDKNQIIEDKQNFDKKRKFGDDEEEEEDIENYEKVDTNQTFENDDIEEPVNDSFEEKLKMARNTISKIKGNKQNNQKVLDLFNNNSFEEEEKLENDELPEEEEKLEIENGVDITKENENKVQPNSNEMKQFQLNSIKNSDDEIENDFNENQFKPNKDKLNGRFILDDISDDDDDTINDDINEKQFKPSNNIVINNEKNQTKFNNFDMKNGISNVKQAKFINNVSDDEEGEEPFEISNVNIKISNKEISNPIKLENVQKNEESEEAHFSFDNIESESSDDELEKKLNAKNDDEFAKVNTNIDIKNNDKKAVIATGDKEVNKPLENIDNMNANDSSSLRQLMKRANDAIAAQKAKSNENEEEDNDNIIINTQIELEEDEEETPIDPYFLDNNLSENSSDMNEDHSTKEDPNKKLPSLEENTLSIKQNVDNSDDSDINDFENLKRNFLKPEFNLNDEKHKQDEEENKSSLSASKTSQDQNIISTDLHKEITDIIDGEEKTDENINKISNNDISEEEDEEEDQILQSLNKFNEQMELLSKSNNKSIIDSDIQKNDNNSKANQNGSFKFLKVPDIEEDEIENENEADDTPLTEKNSNLIDLPSKTNISNKAEEEEYEIFEEEEEEQENEAIKKLDNLVGKDDETPANDLKTDIEKQTNLNESSALDFLNQDDFLEDHLFLSKNKNIKVNDNSQKQPEEEENDEANVAQNANEDDNAFSYLIEEEEEDEAEIETVENNSKKPFDISKINDTAHSIVNIQIPLGNKDDENKIDDQKKEAVIPTGIDMNPKFTTNQLQIEIEEEEEELDDIDQFNLNNKANPIISGNKIQMKNVEYEYEYEIEEDVEEVQKSDETKENVSANQSQIKDEIKEKVAINQSQIKDEIKENVANNQSQIKDEIKENVAINQSIKDEIKENITINQSQIKDEIKVEDVKNDQKQEMVALNPKMPESIIPNEIVEYEYEYEEENPEEVQKTPKHESNKLLIEANNKSSEVATTESEKRTNSESQKETNVTLSIDNIQIEIEIDEGNQQNKNETKTKLVNESKDQKMMQELVTLNPKIPENIVPNEIVEYEYEYEEEKLEQIIKNYKEKTDKLDNELSQIKKDKGQIEEEEEDFDEETIIQRLQNFKDLNFANGLDENEEEEAEEDISDDSLINRLNQGLLLMGKDTNDENIDDNDLDDIDDDVLQKRVQDFLDLPNSDNDIEEESFIEKDV